MESKLIAKQAILAALYAAICIALAPLSYGAVQVRIAEMLMVLPFYNKKHTIGLTIGCFAANLYSLELGAWDLVFGTMATFIACIIVSRLRTTLLIPVAVAAVNGLIIGAELYYVLKLPFIFSAISVGIGEVIAVSCGVAAMRLVEKNNTAREFLCS